MQAALRDHIFIMLKIIRFAVKLKRKLLFYPMIDH